jgi:hypothetical protein
MTLIITAELSQNPPNLPSPGEQTPVIGPQITVTPLPSELQTTQQSRQLMAHSRGFESKIHLGEKDKAAKEKLDNYNEKRDAFTNGSEYKQIHFRTLTGKDKGRIEVIVYYIDENQIQQELKGINSPEFLEVKEAIRELHRELLGPPAQQEPFQGISLPNFQNNFECFFQNGYFEKMNHFVKSQHPNEVPENLSEKTIFSRLYAAETWIQSVLDQLEPLIKSADEDLSNLTQNPSQRTELRQQQKRREELAQLRRDLLEIQGKAASNNPRRLTLNWTVGMYTPQGDPLTTAKLINRGLKETLQAASSQISQQPKYMFSLFGNQSPTFTEEDQNEYSHSAGGLLLYNGEMYAHWCDLFGRNMKADSTERLIITHLMNVFNENAEESQNSTEAEDLLSIFKSATEQAREAFNSSNRLEIPDTFQWNQTLSQLQST